MAVGEAHVFPDFLTPVLTQLFFPKSPTTFLTCLCRGERRKYAGKKSRLNRGSNSQPPRHESDTFTTEAPGRGPATKKISGPPVRTRGFKSYTPFSASHTHLVLICRFFPLFLLRIRTFIYSGRKFPKLTLPENSFNKC